MKNRILSFLTVSLLFCFGAKAQESASDIIRSPQVADMIRYDHTPVALNSGRLGLNIPLLALEDPDFSFPVTAGYNSAGFMPSKPESCIGLNWSLSMGGVIYREVRGMADDLNLSIDGNLKGFLHLLKENKSYNPQSVAATPSQYLSFMTGAKFKDSGIEATPDLYKFCFGPYSGSFSIGYDGKVYVVCEKGGNLEVDLSGYEYFTTSGKSTTIKITTDDGYQYFFGGSKDNMEYAVNYTNNLGGASRNIYPSAFFLYKITAPNGRMLDISYKKIPAVYNNDPLSITLENHQSDLLNYTVNFSLTGVFGLTSYTGQVVPVSGSSGSSVTLQNGQTAAYHYTLTKVALVDEVTCGRQKMKFHYSPRTTGKERFKGCNSNLGARSGAMLDSISLQYQDKTVKSVRFRYTYSTGQYPVFFLTRLTLPDGGSYSLGYASTDNLPDPVKANTDYWNFLRSYSSVDRPVPGITVYDNGNYTYTTDVREPNPNLCSVTLLTTVTYPTGGSAAISYEPHSYSQKVDRTSGTTFKPALLNLPNDAVAGGARVKGITYYDGHGHPRKVAYEYTRSKTDLRSSGTLYYFPKYFDMQKYMMVYTSAGTINLTPLATPSCIYRNVGLNLPSYEQDHVHYSTVREVTVEETTGGNQNITYSVAHQSGILAYVTTIDIKQGVGYWNITGMKTGGSATIYLKQNGVTRKTLSVSEANTVKYVPDVPDGEYEIYTLKTGVYGFIIQVYAPEEHKGFYKETRFTDYSTHPDNFQDDITYCVAGGYTPTSQEMNEGRAAQDCSRERGLVLSETSYNESEGKTAETIVYTYLENSQRFDKYTYTVNAYNGFMQQLNKTYYYPFRLQRKAHRLYGTIGSSNWVERSEDYTYNSDGCLSEMTTQNSDWQTVKHKYTYPADYASESACSALLGKNMRSCLIQKETYVNGTLTEKLRNDYLLSGTLPLLGSIRKGRGTDPPSMSIGFTYDGNAPGRCTGITRRDGSKEVWLWSYDYNHVVARIEGLTYDEVKAIVGESLITRLATNPAPTEADVEQVRSKLQADAGTGRRALVTTYLYKPLVGMVQQIAPNGNKTGYTYNVNNLLQTVRNHAGKVVEEYDYNYKQ